MKLRASVLALLPVLGLAACTSFDRQIDAQQAAARSSAKRFDNEKITLAEESRVVIREGAYIPATPKDTLGNNWLSGKKVSLRAGESLPLSEVVKALAAQGINIVSDLPLDRYTYSGFNLTTVDAETALRMVLGASGLDYSLDNARKLVTVRPLASRTWYLNIGNRKAAFSAGGNGTGGTAGATGQAQASGTSTSGATGGLQASSQTVNVNASISATDDFWGSLKTELDSRLKVMLPEMAAPATGAAVAASLPPLPVPGLSHGAAAHAQPAPSLTLPAASSNGSTPTGSYSAKQMGAYSVNPETGAVTVQAPHWILNDLDKYLGRVQEMYNTDIIFTGELVSVSVDNARSEGFDITSFGRFAGRYGAVVANNALGGVTVGFPTTGSFIPSVTAGGAPLSGALLGAVSQKDGLSLFNAYLSNLGKVTVLQKPHLATTSGVPGDFRRTTTRYYNTVTQQTASSSSNAAVGTQNTLVPLELGTSLKINPRIDLATGLIRAHIVLEQTSETGTQSIQQSLTAGNALQQVTTDVPVLAKVIYSGETLLKDGDIVVVGGQTDNSASRSADGVTGLMDIPAAGKLFGTTQDKSTENVTYFALKVHVQKRQ